jgi:hypothetical protein
MRRRARHPVRNDLILATTLVAALLAFGSCSDAAGPAGTAATITRVSGDDQPGSVGLALDMPLVVRVTDRAGRAVAGVDVAWAVTAGAGSVAATTTSTDAAGNASTSWTLGTAAGVQTVTASTDGAGSLTFSATAAPGPPTAIEKLGGDDQQHAAGMVLPAPLEMRVTDAWGNSVTGTPVTWAVAAGGGLITHATSITGTDGRATATLRLGAALGANTVTASITTATTTFSATAIFDRMDRTDDVDGAQVHVVYVVPSDAADRELDRNGTLARSITSFHSWFRLRSGGYEIRFDTHDGELDITFFRLARTDDEIRAYGAFVVTQIEAELANAGRMHDDKLYLIYYDGGSTWACGGAAWPPHVPGRAAAMYLRGTPAGASCGNVAFVNSATDFPGYWEFAALHDLVHTTGIVSADAPNHTHAYPAHVPERNDLMYSGPQSWIINNTTVIDVNGDDYFGPNVPAGLPDLADSPYLQRTTAAIMLELRLDPLTPAAADRLADDVNRLPMHPPFAPLR